MHVGPIEPFRIHVTDAALDDLRRRLAATRWPAALFDGEDDRQTDAAAEDAAAEAASADAAAWRYGTPVAYLRELVEYWRDGFDWRAMEARLNAFDQFRVEIDGLRIHFVHVRGRGPAPMPLLITHGWPGSFAEILPMVPLLTDPAAHGAEPADAFDVVVPALPGFPFSDSPRRRGEWHETADRWAALMTALGYERFGLQSSDIGSRVMRALGRATPERLIGLYLTTDWVDTGAPTSGPDADPLSADETAYLAIDDRWEALEGGYAHLQGTKPLTLASALDDSPVGLASWIIEKWRAWSDVRGSPEESFSKDELLTNVCLYWFSHSIGSSFIPYVESRVPPISTFPWRFIDVPTGVARLPGDEPGPMPFDNARRNYRVVRTHDFERGGHFAASEVPELLVTEIRHFFRPLREATPAGERGPTR